MLEVDSMRKARNRQKQIEREREKDTAEFSELYC